MKKLTVQEIIQFDENEDRIRVSWNNGKVPGRAIMVTFFALFWMIWAPATLFLTGMLFVSDTPKAFLLVWLIFGWTGTLLIPALIVRRCSWSEWIELSNDAISWGGDGFLAARIKHLPLTSIAELSLGGRDEPSSEPTSEKQLRVYETRRRLWYVPEHFLGLWLNGEASELVFEKFRAFISEKGLPLKTARYVN